MTTALEIGGAFLFMATLLIAVMFLAALQLGRLVTRDDEQREVEVVWAPEVAVRDPRWPQHVHPGSGTSTRPTSGAPSGGGRWRIIPRLEGAAQRNVRLDSSMNSVTPYGAA